MMSNNVFIVHLLYIMYKNRAKCIILNFEFCRNLQLHRIHIQNANRCHANKATDQPDKLETMRCRKNPNAHEHLQHVEAGLQHADISADLRTLSLLDYLDHSAFFTSCVWHFSGLTLEARHVYGGGGGGFLRWVGEVVEAGDEEFASDFATDVLVLFADAEEIVYPQR